MIIIIIIMIVVTLLLLFILDIIISIRMWIVEICFDCNGVFMRDGERWSVEEVNIFGVHFICTIR